MAQENVSMTTTLCCFHKDISIKWLARHTCEIKIKKAWLLELQFREWNGG